MQDITDPKVYMFRGFSIGKEYNKPRHNGEKVSFCQRSQYVIRRRK
jgi:hypothetical protein